MIIEIWNDEQWQRFDRFLRKYFKKHTEIKLSDIYSWIRKWNIKVNWKKTSEDYRLNLWDKISITNDNIQNSPIEAILPKEEKQANIDINKIKKQILYEDDNWIFRDKPYGIVVHPWNKHLNDLTLNEYLEQYVKITNPKILESETFKPAFGFRIDKDTSWIIVAAKNYDALKYLNELIRDRETNKTYLTIVKWVAPKHEIIDTPIFRWYNKKYWRAQSFVNFELWVEAKTEIWLRKTLKDKYLWDISLVEVKIYTWRMHQIRTHLSDIWFHILWDIMYWDNESNIILKQKYNINRQLLHSYRYWFHDKFTKKTIEIQTNYPNDFNSIIHFDDSTL